MSAILHLDHDHKLKLTANDFIAARVAILGTSGNGKTNTLALILEYVLAVLPFTIFDPHNEYYGLAQQYEFLRVGKNDPNPDADDPHAAPPVHIEVGPDQAEEIAQMAFTKRISVLVEMLHMTEDDRLEFVYRYCAKLWQLKSPRKPYGVVLEEAQNFIPETKALTPALKQLKQFALEGRKFGISVFLSSQRSAEVSKTVLGQCRIAFLHGVDIMADVQSYAGMLPLTTAETKKVALTLGRGECIVKIKREGPAEFHYGMKMLRRKTLHVGDAPTLEADGQQEATLRAVDETVIGEFKAALSPFAPAHAPAAVTPVAKVQPKTVSGVVMAGPAPAPSISGQPANMLVRYISVTMAAYAYMDHLKKQHASDLQILRADHAREVSNLEKQIELAPQRVLEPMGYDAPPDQMELLMGETSLMAETITETTKTTTRYNMTSRQLTLRQNAQRRIYDQVIAGAKQLGRTHKIMLIEAYADEQKVVDFHTVAPLYDLSYDTFRILIPDLVDLGLVVKTAPGKIRSTITSYFQTRCPNLETDDLVEGLWKVIGK